jgi:hypothetical protein
MFDKEQINRILLMVTGASVITFAIGSIIINSFLNSYNITDFDVLKPHAVLVGVAFLATIFLHVALFPTFLDINNLGSNTLIYTVTVTIMKVWFLNTMIFLFFEPNAFLNDVYKLQIFKWKFKAGPWLLTASICSITTIYFLYDDYKEGKDKHKLSFYTYKFARLALFICLFLTHRLYKNNEVYFRVSLFEYFMGFNFFAFYWGRRNSYHNQLEDRQFKGSIWSRDKLNENTIPFLKIAGGVFFGLALLYLIQSYTRNIYPYLDQSFGGGKPIKMKFITEKDTFTGLKLHQTGEYIFLQSNDSSIQIVVWKDVTEIRTGKPKGK